MIDSTTQRPDPNAIPGKLQAIAYMTLGGGIFAVLWSSFWIAFNISLGLLTFGIACITIPFTIYAFTAGIICMVHAAKLIGARRAQSFAKTKTTAILQIICFINCDPVNLTCGILNLIFMKDEEVCRYVQSKGGTIPM